MKFYIFLRMYGTYIPNQKFDLMNILGFHVITKIWKLSILKTSRTVILHHDNSEKLSINWQKKKNWPKNNQVIYSILFQINLLIFQHPNRFFLFLRFFFKFWKMNETSWIFLINFLTASDKDLSICRHGRSLLLAVKELKKIFRQFIG